MDLPGTYSLQAGSTDEEVARDFLLFGESDVTVVVVDATRLERNLNLVLQVLEITDRVVVCLHLMDEARRHGIAVDATALSRELGVPVVPASERGGEGLEALREAIAAVATATLRPVPFRIPAHVPVVESAIAYVACRLVLGNCEDRAQAYAARVAIAEADAAQVRKRTRLVLSLAAIAVGAVLVTR